MLASSSLFHELRFSTFIPMCVSFNSSIVNGNNSFKEEIKERISLGNKAFYADLFKSKLLTKNSKLRMYKTLVRPVVTYACETWLLKENIKTKLTVFERKVLRRIYGPTKERMAHGRLNRMKN